MQFDVMIDASDLNAIPAIARAAEEYGFAGLWTSETAHNPFLPLALAAHATQRIELGTAIAVAFPRSPMVTAQITWDLAKQSNGRFLLGLGTQVKAHIVRRFSTSWDAPVERMKEYIESMRAIWANWQHSKPLRYAGEHYKFTLMTPFFNPGAIEHPNIPIYIAGVNEGLCRLAGAMCDGFHVHPFHTTRYLREIALPAIEAGARDAGRTRADVKTACAVFVISAESEDETREQAAAVKQQIAFYASTPSYRPVLDANGWGDLGEQLNALVHAGRWNEMGSLISDDMLAECAVIAPPDDLPHAVKARYDGLLDRVSYYMPFLPDDARYARVWRETAKVLSAE